MTRPILAPALAAALLAGGCSQSPLTGPTSLGTGAGGGSASQAPQLVPFSGRYTGTQSMTPLSPPLVAVSGSATGTATHLGRFTVQFPHTVNMATRIGEGTYTFTAANGDTLVAQFTGQATGAPPLISIAEQATVTGGTGRFAGVSGTFVVRRQFDQATGGTEATFEGTISAVGATN